MRTGLIFPAIALLACGCATARVAPRPAHGKFNPATGAATAKRALQEVTKRGFDVAFNDTARGLILTKTRENQAPCGESSCLARDTLVLRLEGGNAVAVLSRRLFDPALRVWDVPRDPAALDAVEADQKGLLAAFLPEPPVLRLSHDGESCADDANCDAGLRCENRRCKLPGASSRSQRLPDSAPKRP